MSVGLARGLARSGVILALLALGLTGCGVRSASLQNPDKDKATSTTATADSGQGKKEGEAAKPHKPFILDGLIR